jgi:hypothetical protein
MDLAANFGGLTRDLDAARRALKYVALMTGTAEASAIPQSRRVAEYLTGIGVRNEWATPEGGTHTWHTWRGYFRDLLERKLFADSRTPMPVGRAFRQFAIRSRGQESVLRGERSSWPETPLFRWKTVEEDLAGYTIVNRGIDSFQLSISTGLRTGWCCPTSADDRAARQRQRRTTARARRSDDFQDLHRQGACRQPRVPIAFSSITPGPGRWDEAEQRRQTNRAIRDYVATQRGLLFIDLWDAMLTSGGQPREDLWVEDRIHPNHAGYLLRVKIMRPLLGKPDGKSR